MTAPDSAPDSASIPFDRKHREIAEAAEALQHALSKALASVISGDLGARGIGRRLGVDKTLGSQAFRIATAPDAATIVSALPGTRGMRNLLEGLERAGVPDDALAGVRDAVTGLHGIFERTQASPREIATIAAGGLDSDTQRRHQSKIQKLHFETAAALKGEMLDTHLVTWFVTPARTNPSMASLVSLKMQRGYRTLRPLGPRLVYRGVAFDRQANSGDWSRVDVAKGTFIPSLVSKASTSGLEPGVLQVRENDDATLVLADPDFHVGESLTLTFADLIEAIGPIHAAPGQRNAELTAHLATPVRHLYFDVFFDELLPPVEPSGAIYFTAGHGVEYGEHAELRRFPAEIDARFVRNTRLSAAAKVDSEKHTAMLEHAAAMIDRPLKAFRCFRMHIAYPPSYTRAVVRWLLPKQP